jgi:ribosomal protein L35
MKTKKALTKRIKITGGRKIMKRPPGQNHFNAKDSGQIGRNKKGHVSAPREMVKIAKALTRNF